MISCTRTLSIGYRLSVIGDILIFPSDASFVVVIRDLKVIIDVALESIKTEPSYGNWCTEVSINKAKKKENTASRS